VGRGTCRGSTGSSNWSESSANWRRWRCCGRPTSVGSPSVRDEARLGLETDKLVNVLSGVEKPPFPFDRLNGMPLDGWTGREPDRRWTRLLETVEALIVRADGVQVGEIVEAQKRRDRDFRFRQTGSRTGAGGLP